MTITEETALFDDFEDITEEIEFDEILLHCPLTLTTPFGNSNDFILTKLTWSLHDYWILITLHPIGKPQSTQILEIKEKTFLFAQIFVAIAIYLKNPEPHLTSYDFHTLGELTSVADVCMGPYENYYKQQIQKYILDKSNH